VATEPFDILVGPADVWVAAVGTGFPDVTDEISKDRFSPDGSGWQYLGFTEGGVKVTHDAGATLIHVDQHSGPVKAFRPQEVLKIGFSLVTLTLESYALAANSIDVADNGDNRSIDLSFGFDVRQKAMLIRGPSPYVDADNGAQYELPVVVQTGAPTVDFKREDKSVLTLEFSTLEDPNAYTPGERFGRLRALDTISS
jgi:hypothetical protein